MSNEHLIDAIIHNARVVMHAYGDMLDSYDNHMGDYAERLDSIDALHLSISDYIEQYCKEQL